MGGGIAFHVAQPGGTPDTLHSFVPVIAASLALPAGRYVVHARVGISNQDSDAQYISAGIRIRSLLTFSDRLDVRYTYGTYLYLPLQCVLDLPENDTIDRVVATYSGLWRTHP